ncbi:TetR/AcrR family transcriptional regulator [Nocardioides sp. GY 10113]|uniref:TetR/AcrR family transcriptional regulator n=1 Tax=Nocardioides sp. GY 10113 TaxID=2569761 RepID=UPI0010A8A820|nr:TetR/AcrR family transcriptional regulator [Nocardioides sp. GY 10113]TIC83878.1 TetR/AcrR family transcriptional regulator [Nocardioides sp. GY 10113]
MVTPAPPTDGRRKAAAARRREREAQIIGATRQIFDAKGVRDVQIEEIATAVGINRAIVYRHFTGKEEIVALTLVGYLEELGEALRAAVATSTDPVEQLQALVGAFVDYGVAHPAFIDCSHALMTRPGHELLDELSESALFRVGRAISSTLKVLSDALAAGQASGIFASSEDPTLLANMLYSSGLGALQLARLGILVGESAPGIPTVGAVSPEQVRSYLVASALALMSPARTTA